MRTSLVVRIAGLVIVALAGIVALLPFDHAVPIHGSIGSMSLWSSCGAPVREVLRKPTTGGAFAYVPLRSRQYVPGHVACAGAARTRLWISAAGLLGAVLLGAAALLIDRGHGFRRRRRLHYGL